MAREMLPEGMRISEGLDDSLPSVIWSYSRISAESLPFRPKQDGFTSLRVEMTD